MGALRTRLLLREYVEELLKEDDGLYGGYGEFFGRDVLFNIFAEPFMNALGTAAGKTKELSQKSITLLKVAFEAVATSILPFLEDDYRQIFDKEKEEINKIRQEYGKYYEGVWSTFQHDDTVLAAFLYRPDLFVTGKLAQKAPKAAAELMSVLSGGALDGVLHKLLEPSKAPHFGAVDTGGSHAFEGVLREDENPEQNDDNVLVKLAQNRKVKAILARGQQTQQLAKVGKEVTDKTLTAVVKRAQAIVGANSLEQLQQELGKKLPGMDKLAQVPQQDRQAAEQKLLVTLKQSMKDFYVKSLEQTAKHAVAMGVPKNHPYVAAYEQAASKIKAM